MEKPEEQRVVLVVKKTDDLMIALRSVNIYDLERLREWKNNNREFFFHNDLITSAQQQAWFESFQQRPLDLMFVVIVQDKPVGCMGIRLLDAGWDVYNVVLGDIAYGKHGVMGRAFQKMLSHAQSLSESPITLKVLKKNPAVGWYRKQGFEVVSDTPDYFLMKFNS